MMLLNMIIDQASASGAVMRREKLLAAYEEALRQAPLEDSYDEIIRSLTGAGIIEQDADGYRFSREMRYDQTRQDYVVV
jgi:hypothetical protein